MLAVRCPSCGAPAPEGGKTCEFCGSALVPDSIGLGLLGADPARLDGLLKAAQARVSKQPDDSAARCQLGVCLLKSGRPDEAIAELEKAAELSPRAWGALYLLAFAVAAGRSWRNPRVGELAKRALALNADMKEAQSLLHIHNGRLIHKAGGAAQRMADFAAAADEYRAAQALEVPEHKSYIYNFSGELFDDLHEARSVVDPGNTADAESAIKMYQAACQAGYVDSRILTRLGVLLAKTGQLQLAVWELEKALELDPTNDAVRELLASTREKLPQR